MTEPAPEPDWKIPVRAEAREGFRVWVEFNDGVSGEVDLADYAERPEFACWQDRACFEQITITQFDELQWDNNEPDLESVINPDNIYMRLTGLTIEDLYPESIVAQNDRPAIPEPVRVEALAGRAIWLEYSNGESGIVDLSDYTGPVFDAWNDRSCFESVHINEEYGAISWGDDLDLCPDSLYAEMKGTKLAALLGLEEHTTADA